MKSIFELHNLLVQSIGCLFELHCRNLYQFFNRILPSVHLTRVERFEILNELPSQTV